MPAQSELMIALTPVPMFFYRPTFSPAFSTALSPVLSEPFLVPPSAFRLALMPASFSLAFTYKPDAIIIGIIARLPK
jgi:hypothetical protein